MDPQPNVSLNNPTKPPKVMALIALVVAFSLPFILVKTFPHKNKLLEKQPAQTLPVTEEILPPSIATTRAVEDTPINPHVSETKKNTLIVASNTKLDEAAKPAEKPTVKITPPAPKSEWKTIKTRPKDSLVSVFSRASINGQTLRNVMTKSPYAKFFSKLKPNEEVKLLVTNHSLDKMIIPLNNTQNLVVFKDGAHYKNKIEARKISTRNQYVTATLRGSLYATAKRENIPSSLIKQMTEIFTWDIDFVKDVRGGDQFTIIYKASYVDDKLISTGDIIAVSYRTSGGSYQAVRHTNQGGRSSYYTPEGKGLKKAFDRYPLRFSHISSTFSLSRYHPILHYRRAHKGVDLAARIGTPIQATGDGKIEIIGRQNAYGNMIKIKHNNTYSTIYGHMLKFQKGLSKGDSVKRGQVIGYVGQTGLASGPHCHYEFHINNQPKNPTTMNLPRGEPIAGRELARFKANTATLLAQLKLYENARLAKTKNTNVPKKNVLPKRIAKNTPAKNIPKRSQQRHKRRA